jgi:hypothetical protein
MSITKYTAGTSAPTSGDTGISPEANQNTMICIGFAEIEVYGKNGSSWELVGTTTEDDKIVFVPFTTYSEVFFKSNTGSEETMRGVFMEDSLIKSQAPDPTSVTEIGDMPAFSAADAGKVLSVDAGGNLVWITR